METDTNPSNETEQTPDVKPEDAAEKEAETKPEDALGDAGKKALTEERQARKSAEKKATELEAEISRLRRSNAATKGTDLDAIKAEMRQEFTAQLVRAEVKAAAAGRLNDPSDALRMLDLEGLSASDAGEVDSAAIKAAIDKLLTDKPYLAAQSGPKPWGDVGGGQRPSSEPEPKSAVERMARAYNSKSTR